MKGPLKLFLSAVFIVQASQFGFSQVDSLKSMDPLHAFDFWIGEWEVHWLNPDSSYTYAHNTIESTLDGRVLQEHFVDSTSGFKGTSISVYSVADSTWHQAWADNSGGYFDFFGIVDGNKRMFQTQPKIRNGKMITQRMVFYDIEKDGFTWDWESSQDNGETWSLTWRIHYERKQ